MHFQMCYIFPNSPNTISVGSIACYRSRQSPLQRRLSRLSCRQPLSPNILQRLQVRPYVYKVESHGSVNGCRRCRYISLEFIIRIYIRISNLLGCEKDRLIWSPYVWKGHNSSHISSYALRMAVSVFWELLQVYRGESWSRDDMFMA